MTLSGAHNPELVYRHVQWGWIGLPVILFLVAVGVQVVLTDGTGSLATVGLVAFLALIFAIVLEFSRLEVRVGGGAVTAEFGLGWPRRVIELDRVIAVRQVRNRWWYGLGMRVVPRGWMFNVSGLDAVELELDSGRVFRIGTDDPQRLLVSLGRPVA